jgi:hypothetical protein
MEYAMPHTFLEIGSTYLNLDLVVSMELHEGPGDGPESRYVSVQFSSGAPPRVFSAPDDIKALAAWLRKHKAR